MIDIGKMIGRVNTAGTDLTADRVARTLEILGEALGSSLFVAPGYVQQLPDRLKAHLEESGSPRSTARNERYRLHKLLKLAVAQGLLHTNDLRFDTGLPTPRRPGKRGPDQRRHDAYVAFELWCSERRITRDSLSRSTFVDYRDWLKNGDLTASRKEALYSDLRRFWIEQSEEGVLPQFDLPRWNDGSRDNYGLARRLWPKGCKAQFEAFNRGARNQAKEGDRRWRGPLRNVSIADMEKELRQYLGYLHNVRAALSEEATLFSTLGRRENVVGYMEWHVTERCGGEERGYHQNTLNQLAALLEWLGGRTEAVDHYRRIASSLAPVRVRDPFPGQPVDYDRFVQGAMRALRERRVVYETASSKQARVRAACGFRDALILGLLVCRPLRSRNIRDMELGANLYQDRDTWRLRFLQHEAKARHYVCDFPSQLTSWLEFYLQHVRPILVARRATNVLFVTKSGNPLSPQDLWRRLRQIGDEYLGMATNPHLFRYLVPSSYLAEHPEALDEMRALLGHATTQTTIRCYVHTYSLVASRRVASAIREHCPNLSRLAALYPPQL